MNPLFVRLGLQAQEFIDGMNNAQKQLFEMKKSSDVLTQGLGTLKTAAIALIGVWSFSRIIGEVKDLITESTLLAARYTTLGVVMTTVGRNVGVGKSEMEEYAKGLQAAGISALESRQSLIKMAQANISLKDSTALARIAQDAAVIGQINSSEAFGRMIHGIQTGHIMILRTIGLNVNFEQSYKDLARQLGKTTEQLTEQERAQAKVNAVKKAGINIEGVYLDAMETASKQIYSMQRYVENLRVEFGKAFEPALIVMVKAATEAIKNLAITVKDPEFVSSLQGMAAAFATVVKGMAELSKYSNLRSIIGTAGQAGDLERLGFLKPSDTEGKKPLEFQKIVDETMARNKLNAEILRAMLDVKNAEDSRNQAIRGWLPGGVIDAKQIQRADTQLDVARMALKIQKERSTAKTATEDYKVQQQIYDDFIKDSAAKRTKIQKDAEAAAAKAAEKAAEDAAKVKKEVEEDWRKWQIEKAKEYDKDIEEGHKALIEYEKKIAEERLKITQDFDKQYAEMGKSKFDLEREELAKQVKIWQDAGIAKEHIATVTADKTKKIAAEENAARLSFYQNAASQISGTFMQIAQAGGKQSLAAFKLYQAFAITEAIIAANLAAAKVLGQTGIFGIPLSYMVWGQAMLNVAMIAAARPPSYDEGGISNKPGMYYSGVPEAHIPLKGGAVPVNISGQSRQSPTFIIHMENPVFQDLATQQQVFTQIATNISRRVAPGAVVENYNNDGAIRKMIRGNR